MISDGHGTIEPTFPTLESVGYMICTHWRVNTEPEHRCLDCGATVAADGTWEHSFLDYPRHPLRYL